MKRLSKYIVVCAFFIILIVLGRLLVIKEVFSPGISAIPTGIQVENKQSKIEVVEENLKIPWELVFLPNGEMLVTERQGNLIKIGKDKKTIKIEGVKHIGEGGLLGLALDPNFDKNNFIYLYSTTKSGSFVTNRVERYKLQNSSLQDLNVIISGIKGSSNHDGGRIKFGPDGYLYVTTGDAEDSKLAQDKNSLNGKILRVDTNGKPAQSNPFGNLVYSYGHRNPQGLAWDDKGNLWSSEHGPSGTKTGNDEINLIKMGQNYGWPIIKGGESKQNMITPIIESGKSDTWAPSGILFVKQNAEDDGTLFFGGLRGEALYQGKITDNYKIELKANFKKEFGRIRTVVLGPDGFIYILTNNTDGRGTPRPNDDKIIRVNPELFFK